MNNNEKSLIKHALMLYGLNSYYKIQYFESCFEIHIGRLSKSITFSIHNGEFCSSKDYRRDLSLVNKSTLSFNIRSFINHWIRCYNFNETISCVRIRKCDKGMDNIVIISNKKLYNVLVSDEFSFNTWDYYNW